MLVSARFLGAKLSKLARSKANKRKILLSKLLPDVWVLLADINHDPTHVERDRMKKLAVLKLATGVIPAGRDESLGLLGSINSGSGAGGAGSRGHLSDCFRVIG